MKDFIANCIRTDMPNKDYSPVVSRLQETGLMRTLHAAMGMSGETGELMDIIKKSVIYGKPLDQDHLKEELGDVLYYMAILIDELGLDFETVMQHNVNKLQKRYPQGFTPKAALERADKHD